MNKRIIFTSAILLVSFLGEVSSLRRKHFRTDDVLDVALEPGTLTADEYTELKDKKYTLGAYSNELLTQSFKLSDQGNWDVHVYENKRRIVNYFKMTKCRRTNVRYANPLRCDRFKECTGINKKPVERECVGFQMFDTHSSTCLNQDQVNCKGRDIPVEKVDFPFWETFHGQCPYAPGNRDFLALTTMTFALRMNCTHYVHCNNNLDHNVMKCPPSTFFNPFDSTCVDATDDVRLDCRTKPRSYDFRDYLRKVNTHEMAANLYQQQMDGLRLHH